MANVSFQLMVSDGLNPGASKTYSWKHAPGERVWGFSVDPKDVKGEEFLPGTVSFEITHVSYQLIAPGERIINVTVKNTGGFGWEFNLYMSRIGA